MNLKMNSGRKGNSSYTFSPLSLVTMDFGRLQPIRSFSTLLGDDFSSVRGKGLLRCTPQVFPPFGRMNVKSAAFFVPDSQIFSWSSSFHANNKQWRGQSAANLPMISNYQINNFFLTCFSGNLCTLVSNNPSTPPARNTYTFTFPSAVRTAGNTNLAYYKLTVLGWKFYAILKPLGYDFVTYPTDYSGSLTQGQHYLASATNISLVPFLAYCKIWNDYFCNSYQSDQNNVSDALQKIYLGKDVVVSGNTYYNSGTFFASTVFLEYMLNELQLPYESNMYTNAWNNPNDPTGLENARFNQVNSQSLISPYGANNMGEFGSLEVNTTRNVHKGNTDLQGYTGFSQLGHRTLAAIDKFVRRRGLAGSKSVQQLYALFGIQPDEWSKDYVVKLAESSSRVNFSAITSQADTLSGGNGKALGAFAGTGLCGYDLSFNYKAQTYGTIICLSWLNIDPILMHGLSPDVLRTKPLDFYNPDFDGNAYRPIPYCEVTGGKAIDADGYNARSIYGYTNMYDDYRYMSDVVAGAFLDETTQHFAFMRDLTETRNNMSPYNLEMYPQTEDVQYWHIDGNSDLTNPFITSPSLGDRFWFCVDWEIHSNRPILSPENSFNLDGDGQVVLKKNGDGMA